MMKMIQNDHLNVWAGEQVLLVLYISVASRTVNTSLITVNNELLQFQQLINYCIYIHRIVQQS